MSSIKVCDCVDCYNTEQEEEIYHIDFESQAILKKHFKGWMNGSYDDICIKCVTQTNRDCEGFYIIDTYNNLTIDNDYLIIAGILR